MRLLCVAVATGLIAAGTPAESLSQAAPSAAIARLTEVVPGQPIEARAYGGLAYRLQGRAGQQVTVDLRAAGNRPVRIIVANASTTPASAVHNSIVRGQAETVTLPSDALYVVSVMDTSFIPGDYLHTISLREDSGQDGTTTVAAAAGPITANAPTDGSLAMATAQRTSQPPSTPIASAPAVAAALAEVPARCRQLGCWGGMDQNVGRSFSRFEITIPETQRISFYWVTPGVVLRMEKSAYGTLINQDFTLDPATGAPIGFTVLENGSLVSNAAAVEGATRLVYRFVGDRFETNMDEYKRGRWRPWRAFGMFGANESFRSDQAIQQARQDRDEMFGMLGAVVGGVAAGMQTDGDMASITAGMAAGSAVAGPNSEIASAANANFQAERQRYEAQREAERQTIAAMNDPNNPLTQQQRREGEARDARHAAERADLERQRSQDEARWTEDREALAGANTYRNTAQAPAQNDVDRGARDEADRQARQEQAEADQQRREQQARAAEQRERQAQQAREEQERRDQEARQRREQAEREAEARRQEQERQRAAAEAERNRVIDFREAVVLCSLSDPQAQFNNWRCEGPLQMTYVNFEQANVAFHFDQMSCANYRELPRAGPYRAFGCGYGLHPSNPGASRNVPEMLGVFVDGRITFRCPRNISGVCRDR